MRNELFERMPIPRAVILLGLPTVAGMALTVLYNMADMIFVGMSGDEYQLAVMTLLTPVTVVSMAIGSIFGIGGASCISRQLGTKRSGEAAATCSFCVYAAFLAGLVSTVAGLLLLPRLIGFFGAGGSETAALAESYGRLLIWGTVPASLCFTMNQVIRAKGSAREAMNGMALSAAVNLAADPFFILYLGMGVRGSAAASLAADLISLIYYIRLIREDDVLSIRPSDFRLNCCGAYAVLAVGLPTCFTHFLLSGCGILFNRLTVPYGSHAVAAFGVASRVLMLPAMISIGLAKGAQPLIGYNYASGNLRRMRGTIRFTSLLGTAVCLLLSLLISMRGGGLVQIFTNDPDVVWLSMVILNVMLAAMPVSALEAVLLNTFQAMGSARVILALTLSKQLLIYIPLLILFERHMGLTGLILLDPVKEYLSVLLAALFYFAALRQLRPKSRR